MYRSSVSEFSFWIQSCGTWHASCPDWEIKCFWDCATSNSYITSSPLMLYCCHFWTRYSLGTPCFGLGVINCGEHIQRWGDHCSPTSEVDPTCVLTFKVQLGDGAGWQWQYGLMFISSSTAGRPRGHLYFWFFLGDSLSCNHWLWQSWSGNEAKFRPQRRASIKWLTYLANAWCLERCESSVHSSR